MTNKAAEVDTGKVFGKGPLSNVKISTNGSGAEVYFDGKKVHRVMGFKVEMNAQEKRIAQVTLRVQCNLDLDCATVPLLPEPWCWFYKPICDNFVDPRDVKKHDDAHW